MPLSNYTLFFTKSLNKVRPLPKGSPYGDVPISDIIYILGQLDNYLEPFESPSIKLKLSIINSISKGFYMPLFRFQGSLILELCLIFIALRNLILILALIFCSKINLLGFLQKVNLLAMVQSFGDFYTEEGMICQRHR